MRRADRLLQIIQVLRRHRKPIAGEAIARELEVSLRTIYRDIDTLITDGVPIRGEAGVGYVLGDGYDLPPLMFKADEIEAAVLGLEWVKRQGDAALARAAEDAIAKIGVILPKELKPVLFDAGLVVPAYFTKTPDNVEVEQIRRSIRENRKIRFDYVRGDGTPSARTIWPLAIAYFEKERLIIGYCELRLEMRAFRTDRMTNLRAPLEKYPPRRKALLKEWWVRERCKN